MEELFLGVFELQDAKNHQMALKQKSVELILKSNAHTCGSGGCKVKVELWGLSKDAPELQEHFKSDYLKHVGGHVPNFDHLNEVFDTNAETAVCQACGETFSTRLAECPGCGLVY